MKIAEKKIFLIASSNKSRLDRIENAIQLHVSHATVYTAVDGTEALSKMKNVPPHVVITDSRLPKIDGFDLVKTILADRQLDSTAAVFMDPPPPDAVFVDELVSGRVQFTIRDFDSSFDHDTFSHLLARALNFVSHTKEAEYYVRFLAYGDILMNEGEKAEFVYFVKKGALRAFSVHESKQTILGEIGVGEFVGEMAFFNGEARSATVQALGDCELIEVKIGTFEAVLYSRPSWSKALMLTLSKRLKKANVIITKE